LEEARIASYLVKGADGNLYGPADLSTLNQWAAEGRIVADSVLMDQATMGQTFARDLPGLQHHFSHTRQPYQAAAPPYGSAPSQTWQSPPAPSGTPYAPYGISPAVGPPKSKVVAALLAFFLGGLGIHRFYLGHNGTGIAMLVICVIGGFITCGLSVIVVAIWAIVDFIMILTGDLKDASGQSLT
jgi:TM2 domain-containing membrane protein YozV